MPWNANDASRQAQADERFDGSVRSRKSSAQQQRGVHQQPDGPLYNGVTACRGLGGRSKVVLIVYIFIGVIAAIIVAMGLAVL
jgi:hypothetical protein